ncbi:MAG: 3'-5' exonuclease [Mariprofundaceae bacterium]|nr:3'-5' exonuclease [Mariprofundaceae bacterium]
MAEIIPPLNKQTLSRMTRGEIQVAFRLQKFLPDDCLVWYDIPIGAKRRYPDFIILHPKKGLLLLEVKDWQPKSVKNISKRSVKLATQNGSVVKNHPLEQVRGCAHALINMLARDPKLQQTSEEHQGNFIMPYGFGVVFSKINRKQIVNAIPTEQRETLLPDHLMIYRDDIGSHAEAQAFQKQLWGMFHYQFHHALNPSQINRIRWHLFPEIRIDDAGQTSLFTQVEEATSFVQEDIPNIIKVMDIQQEQLARSLGDGHRVIHGVAGSGKTLILSYRCLYLAQVLKKPILVLCFNITLAAKLRAFMINHGIAEQVEVQHFHGWCGQQIKKYHIDVLESDEPYYKRMVQSVMDAVDQGDIPKAQYGALLIDEGHDFEAQWLKLVVQMLEPEENSLLMLYDDAQSIYNKGKSLDFSLSSVGIQAQGRTTILRLNYRNTREILSFAYHFARFHLNPKSSDDDHIPLIKPESAGNHGENPVVREFDSLHGEIAYTITCLKEWHEQGVPWRDMAVLYAVKYQGKDASEQFKTAHIPYHWLNTTKNKIAYDSNDDAVNLLTIHSSKGLEFPRVMILGIGQLSDKDERHKANICLLYVGMTRAQEYLSMSISKQNSLSRKLVDAADFMNDMKEA